MKKTIKAFTLAEALILLLIAALLAAAFVPVITRKHREVGEHGKWICSVNDQKKHVIKTIYRGKTSQFKEANDADFCTFSPPPAAKNFTIKAVAGGGGGGGGTAGAMESIYDSRNDDSGTFATSVENDGNYSIIAVGGGGGGGGMACGEAKDQVTAEAGNLDLTKVKHFLNESSDHHLASGTITEGNVNGQWNKDWSWDEKTQSYKPTEFNPTPCKTVGNYQLDCSDLSAAISEDPNYPNKYKYGYFDMPVSGFEYNLLFQNDKRFTDKYSHGTQNPDPKVRYTDEKGQWKSDKIEVYNFKYQYLPPELGTQKELQDKAFCFAEKNWPMSKEISAKNYKGLYLSDLEGTTKPNIKCWNLPGIGGKSGTQDSSLQTSPVFIKGGQNIYVSVGSGGKGHRGDSTKNVGLFVPDNSYSNLILKKDNVYDGLDGKDGEKTTIYYGTSRLTAAGGQGGASRKLLPINFYINIPVLEYEIKEVETSCPNEGSGPNGSNRCPSGESTDPNYCYIAGPNDCKTNSDYRCTVSEIWHPPVKGTDPETGKEITITPGYYECPTYYDWYYSCSTGSHKCSYYEKGKHVQRVRPKYFEKLSPKINACVYSRTIDASHPAVLGKANIMSFLTTDNFLTGLDYPYFVEPVKEYKSTDTTDGEDYDVAAMFDRQRYMGDPGSGGYGAGEQVKSYVRTNEAGVSYGVLYGEDGEDGYVAIVKSSAYGGTGGQAGQYISTMVKKLEKLKVQIGFAGVPGVNSADGGRGGDTKIYKNNDATKPMFILKGGLPGQAKKLYKANSTSTVSGGDGAPSPIENESNKAKVIPYGGFSGNNTVKDGQSAKIYGIWQNPTAAFTGYIFNFNGTGGHPLDMTYGAGGGGGAGGDNIAGAGGAGTPGVVIIEW